MKPAPCKNCTERYAECHSNCGRYSVWKTEHDLLLEKINEVKKAERDYASHCADYSYRCRKSRNKK